MKFFDFKKYLDLRKYFSLNIAAIIGLIYVLIEIKFNNTNFTQDKMEDLIITEQFGFIANFALCFIGVFISYILFIIELIIRLAIEKKFFKLKHAFKPKFKIKRIPFLNLTYTFLFILGMVVPIYSFIFLIFFGFLPNLFKLNRLCVILIIFILIYVTKFLLHIVTKNKNDNNKN